MPAQVQNCWSCEASGKDAADVRNAVSRVREGKDAKEFFLCAHCWRDRHCTKHTESMLVFLGDMPAALRVASSSQHRPTNAAVRNAAKVCMVCRQHLALLCETCLTSEEQKLRAQGIHRCASCIPSDIRDQEQLSILQTSPRKKKSSLRKCWPCEGSGKFATGSLMGFTMRPKAKMQKSYFFVFGVETVGIARTTTTLLWSSLKICILHFVLFLFLSIRLRTLWFVMQPRFTLFVMIICR